MRMKYLLAAVLVTTLGSAQADDEAMVVGLKRMTMSTAVAMAQAAVDECTKQGIQIGVTVVDRDGVVQVAMRDTIAAPITVPISKGKAYAAVNFNAATSALADRANTPIGRVPGLVMSAGGLPLQVGGSLLGGIGVSGAPSGETDEVCAQAGIDAVQADIEMSM